jgi:ABC-type multidrug transport system, ATPase component
VTPLVSVDAVTRRFGKKRVLCRVSFSAAAGEAIGIIGPNGAGKTTLLRIMVGLLRADQGFVCLDGSSVRSALRRIKIAYFAGESTLPSSVRARTWRRLFVGQKDDGEKRRVRVLSRGTRQMLGLRTMMALPDLGLLVLDEPWEGLDPDATRWLTESLRARRDAGTTIVVSSHRLHDLAGVCDRYVFLDRGIATAMTAESLTQDGPVTGDTLLAAFDTVRRGAR